MIFIVKLVKLAFDSYIIEALKYFSKKQHIMKYLLVLPDCWDSDKFNFL